ncbi:hypothetical protein FXF51_19885 [Nonomuraea sp. PA05]|uniref:hypothetical protein n=1 Tax=Nonomuraea sp. PA05 TaxID=2604466 RepID=UPI0011DA93C7|nr:hypothetical protein [Nonomuraea sp. PA05]TYB65466.1 hypothetical protein FXF51_19885 [Nonomuraea sp. PA05]
MVLRLLAVLTFTASLLVGLSTAAHACRCVDLSPAQTVRNADAVFTGTVTGVRGGSGFGEPLVYTFRADQVYKGAPAARFTLTTSAASSSCGYTFGRSGRYLVFAASSSTGPVAEGGELSSTLCSGNVPVASGSGPLRPGDDREDGQESLGGPVDAELVKALGTPLPPVAVSETFAVEQPLLAEGDAGGGWGWIVVVVLLGLSGAFVVLALRRRSSPPGRAASTTASRRRASRTAPGTPTARPAPAAPARTAAATATTAP